MSPVQSITAGNKRLGVTVGFRGEVLGMKIELPFDMGTTLCWMSRCLVVLGGGVIFSLSVQAKLVSQLQVSTESFLNQNFNQEQRTNFQSVGARLLQNDPKDFFKVDTEAHFTIGSSQMNTLGVHELYLKSENFKVGRALEAWSIADVEWKLGLIEPVTRSRPLDPKTEGLVGFFLGLDLGDWSGTLFASPLFLPEQGPSYEISGGQIVSQDPWFQRPPSYIRLYDNMPAEKINYNVKRPNESQVIFQREFGGMIRSPKESPWFFQSSYLYKPNNQIALTYVGYKTATPAAIDKVYVDVVPKVFYHHVAATDFGWRSKANKVTMSVIYDSPEQISDVDKDQYTYPVFKPALIFSPRIHVDAEYFLLTASRLQTFGGEIKEAGRDSNENRLALTQKYFYRQANSIGISSYGDFGDSKAVIQKASYTFDDQMNFEIIKWAPEFVLSDFWRVYGEVELINAKEPTLENPQQVYNYVDHDRVYFGVGYAF